MYCLCHSGVMCADRCSANLIVARLFQNTNLGIFSTASPLKQFGKKQIIWHRSLNLKTDLATNDSSQLSKCNFIALWPLIGVTGRLYLFYIGANIVNCKSWIIENCTCYIKIKLLLYLELLFLQLLGLQYVFILTCASLAGLSRPILKKPEKLGF